MMAINYLKIQKLGAGNFGEVWKVESDPPNGIWIHAAMKIIKDPNENAWNEVELLKKTHTHQNVVNYYHSFKDSNTGDLCIVMEFCDKGSLASYIPKVCILYFQCPWYFFKLDASQVGACHSKCAQSTFQGEFCHPK